MVEVAPPTAALLATLPTARPSVDPRLLLKASRPGRIRGTAVDLLAEIHAAPTEGESRVRHTLRQARFLHSRERRLVADGVYDLFRYGSSLRIAIAPTDEPHLASWLGWLILRGLPPDEAERAWREGGLEPRDFSSALDLPHAVGRLLGDAPFDEVLSIVAGIDRSGAERLFSSLGRDLPNFLEASNRRAPTILRVDTSKVSRDTLIRRLGALGIPVVPDPSCPTALRVEGRHNLEGSAPFRRGLFEVQDTASQLVASLVPTDGLIVDLCAGAGGKTLALAARGATRLVATDVRPRALFELERRARRASVHVQTHVLSPNGELPPLLYRELEGLARAVLVDAPCSGTGVWRRHPALRARLDETRLGQLARTQEVLLRRAASLLAPGGQIVYATCSVLREENDVIVEAFLEHHPEFTLVPASVCTPFEIDPKLLDGPFLRTAPHTSNTDGFFAAVLSRGGSDQARSRRTL